MVRLFGFIDWIMRLPQELEADFWAKLQQYEEKQRMEYVTSVERIGMAKGMEKGMEKGLREGAHLVLLRLLEHRFGSLPEDVIQQLHLMSVEQAERLVDVALIAPNAEEFSAHLPLRDANSTNSA